jgi:adenine-specific DNA-methyltransferase
MRRVFIVCSETVSTGKTRRMLHGEEARKKLAAHKGTLLARTVRKFKETNWWEWGRAWKKSDLPRVYVNAMTRKMTPFFTHSCTAYDGSVLALFVVAPDLDVAKAAAVLNRVDWEALGFKAGGKFVFSQRALENCLLPQWAAVELAACHTGHAVPTEGAGDGK